MNCNSCGARLYKNAKFCAHCGATTETLDDVQEDNSIVSNLIENQESKPINQQETQSTDTLENKFSGKAITGFVLSLWGIFVAGIPCSILGIIFSSIALSNIKTKNYKGNGLAIAGLVISIIVLIISTYLTISN